MGQKHVILSHAIIITIALVKHFPKLEVYYSSSVLQFEKDCFGETFPQKGISYGSSALQFEKESSLINTT